MTSRVRFQVQHDAIPQVSKDFFFRFLLRLLIVNHGNNVDKKQLSGTLRTNPGTRNMVCLNDEGKVNCSFVSLYDDNRSNYKVIAAGCI